MKLYAMPGACSMASHIVLNELGLPFSLLMVDGATKRFGDGEDYRAINPLGYIPTLELKDGTRLQENPALLIYLGNLQPNAGLAPLGGGLEAARLLEILAFLSSELHTAFSPFFANPTPEGTARDTALARLYARLDVLEHRFADDRDHFLGGGFTVADAFAFVILSWTKVIGLSLERWPHLSSFVNRIARRPAVRRTLLAEGLTAEAA